MKRVWTLDDETGVPTWDEAVGSQPWDESVLSDDLADWIDDEGGTWASAAGVLSQTEDTGNTHLIYGTHLPSLSYVIEAEIRFPTGQDAGTVSAALLSVGNPSLRNPGLLNARIGQAGYVVADAAGDGAAYEAYGACDNGNNDVVAPFPTEIVQDEWHTLRLWASGARQVIYIDGDLIFTMEGITAGNTVNPDDPTADGYDRPAIAATGLVDFRNIKVWTETLPT